MLNTLANGSHAGRAKMSVSGRRAGSARTTLLENPCGPADRCRERLRVGRHVPAVGHDRRRLLAAPSATRACPGRAVADDGDEDGRGRGDVDRRPGSPTARRRRLGEQDDLDDQPGDGQRTQRKRSSPSRSSRPPSSVRPGSDRDRVQDEHDAARLVGRRSARIVSSWVTWLLDVAEAERLGHVRDGHLAARGVLAPRSRSLAVSVRQAQLPVAQARVDPGEQTGSGSVRSRSMRPMRIGSSWPRPNGTTASRPPATMRSSSPSQNGSISATWASTSRGPHDASGSTPKALGERPRLAGDDPRLEAW